MSKVGIAHERVNKFFSTDYSQWLNDAGISWHPVDLGLPIIQDETEILVTGNLSTDALVFFPNLKAVIVPFSGINGLDIDEVVARNIRIFNTTIHSKFVAERALLLTLAVMGKLIPFHKALEKGDWSGRAENNMESWTSLFDKKVAIYGYGNVGKDIHRLLEPFNCQVGTLSHKGREYEGLQMFEDLSQLADWCDVLIISAPLNNSTNCSVDCHIFNSLKGKILINVGRGEIVEENALYDNLNNNNLGGFGSDVWYQYPSDEYPVCQPSQYPISNFKQVVITPHNGGFEDRADEAKYVDVADKIRQILAGDYSKQVK